MIDNAATIISFLKRSRRRLKGKINRLKKKRIASFYRTISLSVLSFETQIRFFKSYYGDKVIYVDTKSIQRVSYTDISPDDLVGKYIFTGDWDIKHSETLTSASTPAARTVHHVFVEGKPFETSEQYIDMVKLLRKGTPKRNCNSIEDIKKYGESLSRAFHNIRNEGYKSQRELGGKESDEVAIYIDRYGRLINGNGGRHRIEIARILNIKKIPVVVRGVHVDWVDKCYSRYGKNIHYAIERGLECINENGEWIK